MTSFIYLIPIIFAVILFIFFRTKVVWWEYLILIVPSMIITGLIQFGMISSSTSATEYLGDIVTEVRYYEPWNEWITETCSTTTTDSKGNSTTTYYDCSHSESHSAKWTQITSTGSENNISQEEFNRLAKIWSTPISFIDMHRDYYTIDGNMYSKKYDNNILTSKTITTEHTYTNKIKNSYSIFGFNKIDKVEAKKLGLYDYPKLYGNDGSNDQSPFLGYKPTKNQLTEWQYVNGTFGPIMQVRVFLLFFYNKPLSIVQQQRSYWIGGNKNELVYCFGVDSVSKKIQWVDAFSWSDKPAMEVNFRSFYTGKDKVDLDELATWTQNSIPKYWSRKQFKDFDYIEVKLSDKQLLWLFIISMIVNLGLSIWIVMNSIEYDENGNVIDKNNNYRGW
jgi:energy-coupling factor transporter transmembrane protein EcfT